MHAHARAHAHTHTHTYFNQLNVPNKSIVLVSHLFNTDGQMKTH